MRLPLSILVTLACLLCRTAPANEQALDDAENIYRRDGPQAALATFEALAVDYEAAADTKSLGRALRHLGEIHWRLGHYPEADAQLQRARELSRKAGDRLQEGKSLNVLGLLAWDLGEFDLARARFAEGSAMASEAGDRKLAGAILNNLGLVEDELGRYDQSLANYRGALEQYEGLEFPRGRGDTLGNIGGVHLLLGRYRQALDHYQQALEISRQLGSVISSSQDHGNVALALYGLGRQDEALTYLDQAIELARDAGMQQDQAYWLRQRGYAMTLAGRYERALVDMRTAMEIYQRIESGPERVEALHDLARLHLSLGDSQSAEQGFREAMSLARQIGLTQGVTSNLMALGDLHLRRDDFDAAVSLYGRAEERAREAGEMSLLCAALLRRSRALSHLGQPEAALKAAARALEIARETGARGLEAEARYRLADWQREGGHSEAALQGFQQVLGLLSESPDADLEWRAFYGQGQILAGLGSIEQAIAALKSAILVIETVRERLQQERFRSGYIQDKYQVYVDLVTLQLRAGRMADAFSTAERLRSKSYLDLLGREPAFLGNADDAMRDFTLRERIRVLRDSLLEENRQPAPEQRQAAVQVYSRELRLAERDYQAFLDERLRRGAQRRVDRAPTYADIARLLKADEALVEYVVGAEQVMYFLITPDGIDAAVADLRREDLENKVELLRSLIRGNTDDRWLKPAASLARHLLAPLEAGSALVEVAHLYIVPHGMLNYLPFALLPVDSGHRRLLVEEMSLAYLPTATALQERKEPMKDPAPLLAMAPARSHLQFADQEARAVRNLFGPDARVLVGETATESTFKATAKRYRLLHLATHGYFNRFNPLLSGLELEADEFNDGKLELHEILGLQLGADLVTLSACRTGLGSGHFAEIPAGDDFVGLTRAFLFAGSASVLATLWEIDDASTMDLMKDFYSRLSHTAAKEGRAVALAKAQRRFLASDNYRHPYYWAPFVLVGHASVRRQPPST